MATSKSTSSGGSNRSTTTTSSTSTISGGFKSNPGSAFGQNGGISIGNGLYSNPSFGGGGNSYQPTYTPPTASKPRNVPPTIKQQIFNIRCTGLKPNTIHRFFYEGVDTGSACLPINPKPSGTTVSLGSPLITDANGNMEFSFYFTSDIEKTVDGVNKVRYELAGDKKFEVRASDSSASRVVPYRKY